MPGFALGVRSFPNGCTEIFRRDAGNTSFDRFSVVDASAYLYKGSQGLIGVKSYDAQIPSLWDDFGGGNAPTLP
jgi:hypothetical protein